MSTQPHLKLAPKDYFKNENGLSYAGSHYLVDLWEAEGLDDPQLISKALSEAAVAAGATILHEHFHVFSEGGGVSGVIVLSESHISIHTWPERGYAAIDIFMCGAADPAKALPIIRAAFTPGRVTLAEQKRGIV